MTLAQFTPEAREIRLSKSDALKLTKAKEMPAFLNALSAWAERLGQEGFTIRAEPEEGPGTMVWRAISPATQAKELLG